MPPQNLRAVGDRIEQLARRVASTSPTRVRYERAEELLRLVTELYGGGLGTCRRAASRGRARRSLGRLVDDELISSLLSSTACIPTPSDARRARARGVRPFLAQHGGDVELLDIDADAGAVLLRLLGSCDGCPSSAVTLQLAVERAIIEAAPEIVTIDVERAARAAACGAGDVRAQAVVRHCPSDVTRERARSRCCSGSARRRPVRRRGRGSAASCAPSRSPSSTATSSTSRQRNLHVRCRGCYLLFTPRGRGRRPLPGRSRPLPRVPRPPAVARAVGRPADPGERRVLLRELDARAGRRVLSRAPRARPSRCSRSTRGTSSPPRTPSSPRSSPTSRRSSCASTATTAGRVLPRADRRVLRARRPAALAVAGLRRRRARRTTRSTRSSTACGRGAMTRPVASRCSARAPEPYAAVPTIMLRLRITETTARTGARGRAAVPDPHRAAAAVATTTTRRSASSSCSARPPQWGDSLRPFLWTHVATTVTGFDGTTEIDLPGHVHLRLRGRGHQVPPRARRRRDPARAAVLRHHVHAGDAGFAVDAGGVGRGSAVPAAGQVWRDTMDLYFPNSGWLR